MTVDDGKQLFGQGTSLESRLVSIPVGQPGQFLFEKVERKVLFRFEIVEQRALRNSCVGGDLLGCCSKKTLLRKQIQRRPKNFFPGAFFVLRALSGGSGLGPPALRLLLFSLHP